MERIFVECGGLLSARERYGRQCYTEATLDGERVWRECGRTVAPQQAFLLCALRGDPDCTAAGVSSRDAFAGVSAICAGSVGGGWDRSDYGYCAAGRA